MMRVDAGSLSDHVGFTGTRLGMTGEQSRGVQQTIAGFKWAHHGDCVGSDAEIHEIARVAGLRIVVHPPNIKALRAFCQVRDIDVLRDPKGYVARDHDIVDESALLVAAPASMAEVQMSGTWLTVRYARKLGRPITIVFPDGSVTHEGGGRFVFDASAMEG